MKNYKVKISGTRPLLHKRFPIVTEDSVSKKKRGIVFNAEAEAEACLYKDENGKIYQPVNHIEGALIKGGAQIIYKGRKTFKDLVAQGLTVVEEKLPLNQQYEIDITTSVIPATRGRIPVARPRWDSWEFEFTLNSTVDDDIDMNTLKSIVVEAGKQGIGTYRQKYGKFKLVDIKEIK